MSYTGTKLGQDIRFKDPNKDILLSMKTPKIYSITVSKQNIIILPIIKLWLNQKIIELLEFEDETLVNLILNLITNSPSDKIDPKNIQYQLSGFLGDKTYSFMKQFWKLLINVQEIYLKDKSMIPNELIPFKIEYDKNKQENKKFGRYKEYEEDYKEKKINKYNNEDDRTKIELMEIIDSYKIDEKYKNKFSKEKNRDFRSYSRNNSHDKKKYKSRSRSRSRSYNKDNSRSRRRHRRKRSRSSSQSKRINKERRRKYSKDSSYSSYYENYSGKNKSRKEYDNYKHKKELRHISSNSSSDSSSETFKI
jgi:serine/arginine repetitive matrix protein 1